MMDLTATFKATKAETQQYQMLNHTPPMPGLAGMYRHRVVRWVRVVERRMNVERTRVRRFKGTKYVSYHSVESKGRESNAPDPDGDGAVHAGVSK